MDINSLLSPQDSPARETPPPSQQPALASPSLMHSPGKRPIRQMLSRTPSGLSQQVTSSPQPHPGYQQIPSPGVSNFASTNGSRGIHSATSTPPIDRQSLGSPHDARMTPPHPLHRQASTPGMDTLADLASMQHQQQAARQSYSAQRPSISLQNIPRTLSSGSANDIVMAEPSPKPRTFSTKALDQQHVDYLYQLDKSLAENPFDYYSHVSFVTVLHQGLQDHLATIDPTNPRSYELLNSLREAYETLSTKYPLGEKLWAYRLGDEQLLARNVEERMSVLELYKQATLGEPFSAKLWVSYGDYVGHLIACSWDQAPPEQWTDEDKQIGRELFTVQLLLDTWQQGADKVKYNIADGSLVWDRYLQFLEEDLERGGPNQEKVLRVAKVFNERLGQPHATWANTLSRYASFIQRYDNGNYEEAMEFAVQKNNHIKQQYAHREEYEFKLLQAIQEGDQDAEYHALTRYLKWEKKTMGVYSFHLVNALYERATLRFPVDATLWEDHVEFLIWQNDRSVDLLEVLERATQHCPWSGSLWNHRILTLEEQQKGFQEIERVKHMATGTGMLEHTNLEELIKVQIAWCGYLRRKAFDDPKATEDDADIAEVGIRSALELVNETGMKKYGRDWRVDSKYRLERIHIKFWLQRGNVDEARRIWNTLVPQQEDSYDFWYRYYIWEMVVWANHAIRDDSNAGQPLDTPSKATAVLEQGMKRLHTIDQPEPLVEMYTNHCEQHESVLKVRSAAIERRRAELIVSIRREKESVTASAAALPTQNHVSENSGKRKRGDATEASAATKKSKQTVTEGSSAITTEATDEPIKAASEAPSEPLSTTQKRDREHSSIIVRNLPADTTQTRVRQFFTDAGNVRNIILKPEKDGLTANVEFETSEEAEYALTKEAKGFDGHDITISRGENTTLYVANYPAHADEAYIRKLFLPYGEILELRFPSLKFDTHRRFCYVQFASANDAMAATKLDGTDVDGLKMIAKISNPNVKKKRDGATAEGREVYLWNLNFKVRVRELKEALASFGKIERVNMPTVANGGNKGFAFVSFSSKEAADKAVAEMHGKDFWGIPLNVEIATDRGANKPKIKSTIENNEASPQARDLTAGQGDNATDAGAAETATRDRSIAILDIPDTVNDARVRELVKPYGYKKITLMPQHGGAIVEFNTVEAVGKAELELAGKEIVSDRKIRFGTVTELKKQKGEYRAKSNLMPQPRINRPTARGNTRGRGRGGLGFRPAASRAPAEPSSNGDKAKSNQEFRAMLLGKKIEQSREDKMQE